MRHDHWWNTRMDGVIFKSRYVDLYGNPVRKTPSSHPYSYDEYVLYQSVDWREDDSADYSDRLYQWNSNKFNECCYKVWGNHGQYFNNRKHDEVEKFLRMYHGNDQIKLTAIVQGCNLSSGYPYWVFFYKEVKSDV